MQRIAKIGIFLVLSTLAVLVLLQLVSRRRPSALYVHIDGLAWIKVTVQSENLPQPQSFDASREVSVTPISHGVYRIGVQLSDGQLLWTEFFHSDAGVRRRVDVFLAPASNPGWIHFRETANQKDLLFDGETRPSDSTELKPFRLDWI
jgi:hypothetical protein